MEREVKLRVSLDNLERAVGRLEEAVKEPATENALAVDGTIQRFEFVFELFWKTFKRALEVEGIEARTPREALSQAYQAGWINDEVLWLGMLKDHNETSHIYDEDKAKEIYRRILEYAPEFRRILNFLKARFEAQAK